MGYDSSEEFEVARLIRQSIVGDLDEFLERQSKLNKRLAPMQLDKDMVETFVKFVTINYAKPEESVPKSDLHRFMIGGHKLMIIREVYDGSVNAEVWMSDKKLLQEIEQSFYMTVAAMEEKDGAPEVHSTSDEDYQQGLL